MAQKFLRTKLAGLIYEEIENLPIVDIHNHIDVEQLERTPRDIWELMCEKDHYIIEMLNSLGVSKSFLEGPSPNKEKFKIFVQNFYKFAGTPTFDWFLLDLENNFKIKFNLLSEKNSDEIWSRTSQAIKSGEVTPAKIIKNHNIEIIGTTNQPWEDLKVYKSGIEGLHFNPLRPTFRADDIIKVTPTILEKFSITPQASLKEFIDILKQKFEYFIENKNLSIDVSIEEPKFREVKYEQANEIFKKALKNNKLTPDERNDFESYMICDVLARWAFEAKIPLQLKIGAVRNVRKKAVKDGADLSDHTISLRGLEYLANKYDPEAKLYGESKILVSVKDPSMYSTQAEYARIFPNIYYSGYWWTQDSPEGIEIALKSRVPIAGYFKGVHFYTDARSITIFKSRYDMFKQVLSNFLAEEIIVGKFTLTLATQIAAEITYHQPKKIFNIT